MEQYTQTDVLLSANNIGLRFGDNIILQDVNFKIHDIVRPPRPDGTVLTQGQIVALVGISGKGKTQLLRILAGLTKFTPVHKVLSEKWDWVAKLFGHKHAEKVTGEVLINKEQIPVQEGNMGIVFQDYYMPEHLKIRKMWRKAAMKNPAFKKDKKLIDDAIAQIAAAFEITQHLDKYPVGGQLSGGQKQRANMAMQLLNGSNFILMDEPFSGLDALMIDKILNLLRQVSQSDEIKTFLIVSHDLENCVAIADHILVLSDKGREPNTGSTIIEEINLIDLGLAWNPNAKQMPAFHQTVERIKNLFA